MAKLAKKLKCPKCGSPPESLYEVWKNHGISFDVGNGHVSDNGHMGHQGYPYRVEAHCGTCGHVWKLRGVLQVTDLHDS